MKKTVKKQARKNAKTNVSFGDVIDSIPEEIPVYQEIGSKTDIDVEYADCWVDDEKEPDAKVSAPVEEVKEQEVLAPKEEEQPSHKVTRDELIESIQRLIKIIRFIYGKAKHKVKYDPNEIAKATRWVDEAERQLVHIRKEILNEEEKGKGN